MAEGVLFDIAGSIITSLSSSAFQEIGVLWGFKDELRKLGNTVSAIQAVLLDAEEKQAHNHAVKNWLQKLKDAMYDADDLLDDYSTQLLRRQMMTQDKKMAKEVRIFFSKSNQLAYGLKMGHRIKAVRTRLDEIVIDKNNFNFIENHSETQIGRHAVHSHVLLPDKDIIGREDERKDIKELLFDSDEKENVSIIPIVGIGGLGKTILAQCVFNDEEVEIHFDIRMWVCVSYPFVVKTIIQKIIECATKRSPECLKFNLLQTQLKGIIDGKRYLLVLDDVWNESFIEWFNLKNMLVGGLRGSKVLITTRSKRVAEITGTMSPYILGGLSEINSWNLFKKVAFGDWGESRNPNLVEIGRQIVRKCAGVPLALRTIGGMLCFKNSEEDWLDFKNNELYKITQQDNDILPILKLSYDHLPSQLKQCFAFCSLFPKDSIIEVEVLIQLWIAQGLIHSSNSNRHLEDVGREYFMHLLSRLFFQDTEENENGDIVACKMHILIHDLAEFVAGNECIILNPNAKKVIERTRHVAFDSLYSIPNIPATMLKSNKIRTLIMRFPTRPSHGHMPIYKTLISQFKCLRALNVSGSNIQEVPNSIGKLKHLRFLDLSWNEDMRLLPTSITKLQNLQTLRLEFCRGLKELPDDTRNLINLRHLTLDECNNLTHMPHGLGQLTALQTLTLYNLGKKESFITKKKGGLGDLYGLNELRGKLHIKCLEHLRSSPLEDMAANLGRKQHIFFLKLEWDSETGDDSDKTIANDEHLLQHLRPHLNLRQLEINGYVGVRLSSWVPLLLNLVSITISNCKWLQNIPPLDLFPFLKHLSLQNLSALEYISYDGSDVSSSSLERLRLDQLPKFRGWQRIREAVTTKHEEHHCLPLFPCVSSLYISDCNMISLISVTTTKAAPGSQTTSSSFSDLSKLKFLCLKSLEELESLPEGWLQNLMSLEKLEISWCRKLRISMSSLFQHLTALEDLQISNCGELICNDVEEGVQCLGPTMLRHLHIESVPSLVSLPVELRHVTTLQGLDILDCPSLVTLPEWITNLTSLQTLQILNCSNLISLPGGMRCLTSLRRLTIKECPHVEERCEEGIGEDWPKIAHIPNFSNQRFFY